MNKYLKNISFSEIREIITLSTDLRAWNNTHSFKDTETAISASFFNMDRFFQYFEKKRPLLIRMLDLKNAEIHELCALMWIGRDYHENEDFDWSYLVDYAARMSPNPNYLVEKSPLSEYLLNGLKKIGLTTEYEVHCNQFEKSRSESFFSVSDFGDELYQYLRKNPNAIFNFTPRRFEELIADILENLGYEVHLTKQTRDEGRDILAYFSTPVGKTLTIVDCKRYSPERKIGIETVERFLYVLDRKDDASMGLMVTTSSFSREARNIEKQRKFRLKLRDFEGIKD